MIRSRSVDSIINEIKEVKDNYFLDVVNIGDDIFLLKPKGWLEEFAEKYPKLDYKYGNDAEVKEILNRTNEKIFGETASNSVSSGNVDMTPNARGKKEKDKVIKRSSD